MKSVSLQSRVLAALQHDACWLCGEPIDPKAKNARRATVDHVIPRSKVGSSNGIWNLAAAHYKCNQLRMDQPPSSEAWARLDALHLELRNLGVWVREDDHPSAILEQQRCYRLLHGAPPPDITVTRAVRKSLTARLKL